MKLYESITPGGRTAAARLICLLIFAAGPAAGAECLSIKDNSIEEVDSGYGVTTAEWTASVHNSCDVPYDGTLTIRLMDTEGHVIYEAVQIVVVEGGYDENVSRRINISSDQFETLEDVEVAVKERERPR